MASLSSADSVDLFTYILTDEWCAPDMPPPPPPPVTARHAPIAAAAPHVLRLEACLT